MKTRHEFERLRERLLTKSDGAKAVINALSYLRGKHPRIAQELRYFRKNRERMRYAEWKSQGFMIESGVVEAACKTLVAQRLKRSGMRWSKEGAQAILTMRGWDQSDRFDNAWALVASTYERELCVLANVVDITPAREKTSPRRASRCGLHPVHLAGRASSTTHTRNSTITASDTTPLLLATTSRRTRYVLRADSRLLPTFPTRSSRPTSSDWPAEPSSSQRARPAKGP